MQSGWRADAVAVEATPNGIRHETCVGRRVTAPLQASLDNVAFRTIFRASPAAIGISRGGWILEANDRFCEFFGYPRSELISARVQDLLLWADPEDRGRIMAGISQGPVGDFAARFRRKDGVIRDALVAADPFEDGAEPQDGAEGATLLITIVDVTDLKRVEAELRESRSFLEQAQTVGHIGSWVSDAAEGGSVMWSDETKRIFGFEGRVFDGRLETFFSLIHPDDLEAVRAAATAALVHGEPYAIDHRIVRPDGSIRVVHEAAEVVRDAAGQPVRMVGVVQDITESRAANELLRASEERYRILFDESPMPMWAYDPESLRIVMANQAAALQYGHSAEELTTLSLPDIRPRGIDAEGIRDVNRKLSPGRQSTGTWEHRRKDGSHLDVDVHLTDVSLGGRRLKLAMLHDVTKRRTLEEQLRQSQKMEAIGRLAGGVAHDFNNLLTVILGYGDLLASRFEAGDAARAEVDEISRAAERAAALTQQLLAFSRKQVLVPKALDLGSVVGGVLKMLERLIGEDVSLGLVVAPDLGRVLADPGQMEQVVMNLAVNARDAMPRGGELLIDLRNVDLDEAFVREHIGTAPGRAVRLSVRDTGVGMSPEVQKQIFEPFFTTKAVGEGTGLGLSTVFGIVSQSGGTIWVESQVGRGTTFSVYLPRIVAAVEPDTRSGLHRVLGGTGTILLVEDEVQLRRLATTVLERKGYTVLATGRPADALRLAREHPGPIDLLLTDVVMPEMSGPDLAASFLAEHLGVPVLFMSGYTNDAIVSHGIGSSSVQFLQKPFTPRSLAQRVQEVLLEGRGVSAQNA